MTAKKIKNASQSGKDGVKADDTKQLVVKQAKQAAEAYIASPAFKEAQDQALARLDEDWVDDTKKVVAVNLPGDVKEGDVITLDMDTRVILHGKVVDPVAVDLVYRNGEVIFEGRSVRVHHSHNAFQEHKVNAYRFKLNGREVIAFLDKDSFLENTEQESSYPWDHDVKRFNSGDHAVILINSTSLNDNFIGVSFLQNVESSNNLLNASSLRALTVLQGHRDHYRFDFELDEDSKPPVFKEGSKRHVYRDCQFKRTSVVDSKLLPGMYRNSVIVNFALESVRRATVEEANIKDTIITASELRLERVFLSSCRFNCEGGVHIRAQTISRQRFYNTSLYLPNKFNYMTIPVVGRNDLKLARISETELELGTGRNNVVRLKLDDVGYGGRDAVAKVLEENDRHTALDRVPHNEIARSIMNFVMDSLNSRIRMISLIDAAAGAASVLELNTRQDRWDNVYEI